MNKVQNNSNKTLNQLIEDLTNEKKCEILRYINDLIAKQAQEELIKSILIEEEETESQVKAKENLQNGLTQVDEFNKIKQGCNKQKESKEKIVQEQDKNTVVALEKEDQNEIVDENHQQHLDSNDNKSDVKEQISIDATSQLDEICFKQNKDYQQKQAILSLREEDLFQKQQFYDINEKIANSLLKIIPKPSNKHKKTNKKQTNNKHTSQKATYQAKKKINKEAKTATRRKNYFKANPKSKQEKPISNYPEKLQKNQQKSMQTQDNDFDKPQNIKHANIINLVEKNSAQHIESVSYVNQETQTDNSHIQSQNELSEINFNIGFSNYEKIKIELLSIQLRNQIQEGISLLKCTEQQIEKLQETHVIGFSNIQGQYLPYVQQSPFFTMKDKLSLKNQILFDQYLKENANKDQALLKSTIILPQEDAALIQKTLHKVQQQFRKQKK